ncbi:MAG: hypothetical protein HYX68_22425 [Planctomycetes bacterium]|jgi:hypothetical protein|nr:hypothetical protein [Planctomycetota bacterium]
MMKWTLACAGVVLAGFLAVPAGAQEAVPTPTPGTTVVQSTTQTQRSGLLGRLLGRRGRMTSTVSQPSTSAKAMPSATPSSTGVRQAQAVEVQTVQTRQGLLGRLRSRIGR